MVELKQLTIGQTNALGIRVCLPRGLLRLIIKDHMIVCDQSLALGELAKKYPEICLIQCTRNETYSEMLEDRVIQCSKAAARQGVCLEMRIADVLTLL